MMMTDYSLISFAPEVATSNLGRSFIAILENSREHSKSQKVARKAIKLLIVTCSLMAKVPFIPINLKLPAGPLFAVCNSAGFFVLEYWSASAIINDLIEPKNQTEKESPRHKQSSICKQITILSTASVIALASQTPVALAAAKYNAKGLKTVAAVVMFISGSLFPTRSLQLSMNKSLENCLWDKTEKKLLKLKNKFIDLLNEKQFLFTQMDYAKKMQLIQALEAVKTETDIHGKTQLYVRYMLPQQDITSHTASMGKRIVRGLATGTGVIITGILQYALARYSFTETKTELWDNDYLAGAAAGVTILSNFYLMGKSITNTTQRLFTATYNLFAKDKTPSLGEQLRPKLSFCLKTCGFLVDAFSIGASIVIWGDFFNENITEKRTFQIVICSAIFLLLFSATLDVINDIVESHVLKHGTDEEKQIIELYKKMKSLTKIIEKSYLMDFGLFFMECPKEQQQQLLKHFKLTSQQLNSYIAKHQAQKERPSFYDASETTPLRAAIPSINSGNLMPHSASSAYPASQNHMFLL